MYQPGDLPKPNSLTCAGGTGYGVQKMKKSLLAAAITLAAAPAFAEIDPIVIYKTSPLGLNDRQTAQAITVITREQIETSGVQSVAEALSLAPGVAFNYPTSRNHNGKVRLAGAKSEQILILIDGMPLSDGRNGYPDLSVINLQSVESIELVRGNASAQLGNGAVAGAVVITTRTAQGNKTELTGSAGSFNTRTVQLTRSQVSDRGVTAIGSVYRESSDGFNVRTNNGSDDKDGFEDQGGQLKVSLPIALGVASFSVNKNSGEYEYDDGVNEFDNFAFNSTLDTGKLLSRLSYAKNEKKAADSNTQTYVLKQTQVELQYSQTDNRLFGLNLLRENTAGSSLSNGENSDSIAIFGEQFWNTEAVNIHAAARVVNNTDWDTNSALTLSISRADQSFSPFLNLGTAFRAPTELDINGYDGTGDGDTDDQLDVPAAQNLKTETSRNIEVGFNARADRWAARLGLRRSSLENAISAGYAGSTLWGGYFGAPSSNASGTTRRYGYDFDLTHRGQVLTQTVNVARSVRENADGSEDVIFPEYTVNYEAKTEFAGIEWTAGGRYESKRTALYSESDSYTVARLGATKYLTEQLQLSVNIQNLFDREYAITSDYQAPRRSTTLTAKYRF